MGFLLILNSINSPPVALFIDLLDCIVAIVNKTFFFYTEISKLSFCTKIQLFSSLSF